jgi:3-deoxy-alpha-D-manno-octulosonate 8-oxidase
MAMLEKQNVALPKGICKNLSDGELQMLYEGSIVHEKPLTNALGPDFKKILSREKMLDLFRRM